jgi:hypothetical protein
MDVTEDDISKALNGMMRRFEAEYQTMTEAELEQRWYFRYEPDKSRVWNMYQFFGCLTLYGGSCMRWEEIHNGHMCVVERVRDKYLMPKIKEFERLLTTK